MRFADIPGNDGLKRILASMADSGRMPHALMLHEDEGCWALPLALACIQYLNCSNRHDGDSCGECRSCRYMSGLVHPDTYFVFPVNSSRKTDVKKPVSESFLDIWRELVKENPRFSESELYEALGIEGKSGVIAIAEAKFILDKLSLSAVGEGYRTVLMWLPEKMNAETANKLLKVVEEPPEKTLFIFVTHSPDKVLQTISSRCQHYRVMPVSKDAGTGNLSYTPVQEEYMSLFVDLFEGMASRNLQAVLDASDAISALDSKEKQKGFCIFAGECIRNIFMLRQGMPELVSAPQEYLEFFRKIASKAGQKFCSRSMTLLDRSVMLLDRNVNQKMVFCDLAGQMFLNF